MKGPIGTVPVDWLLAGEAPVRYRTLVDLLDVPGTDPEVAAAREAVPDHPPVRQLLARRNADGYWGASRDIHTWWPRKDTTFWVLGVLADLGLDRHVEGIDAACEYVLGTQHESGGFGWAPPPTPAECFTGILAEALAGLGYREDPRLERAFRWLESRQRPDGGFWCKNTGQPGRPREGEPSCAFASLCVLRAFAEHPTLRESDVARRTLDFMLGCWEMRGRIKLAGHDSRIGEGWDRLKYPFTDYRILVYLDALSRFPSVGADPRTREVLDLLAGKADAEGRFRPESVHGAWSSFDFGQKRRPSRWLTLLAHRAARRLEPGGPSRGLPPAGTTDPAPA